MDVEEKQLPDIEALPARKPHAMTDKRKAALEKARLARQAKRKQQQQQQHEEKKEAPVEKQPVKAPRVPRKPRQTALKMEDINNAIGAHPAIMEMNKQLSQHSSRWDHMLGAQAAMQMHQQQQIPQQQQTPPQQLAQLLPQQAGVPAPAGFENLMQSKTRF